MGSPIHGGWRCGKWADFTDMGPAKKCNVLVMCNIVDYSGITGYNERPISFKNNRDRTMKYIDRFKIPGRPEIRFVKVNGQKMTVSDLREMTFDQLVHQVFRTKDIKCRVNGRWQQVFTKGHLNWQSLSLVDGEDYPVVVIKSASDRIHYQ